MCEPVGRGSGSARPCAPQTSGLTCGITCATWLMQKGVNLWDAAGFLGMTPRTSREFYLKAQLVKHIVRDVGVAGSNPATPTIFSAQK
jgi:hypothetical protein